MTRENNRTGTGMDDGCEDYGSASYWESRYTSNSGSDSGRGHSWYFTYPELSPLLVPLMEGGGDVLEIGCGDMPLGPGIAGEGIVRGKVICTDISKSVIEEMKKESGAIGEVEYVVDDATSMIFEDGSFHLIVDKGTLDALLSTPKSGITISRKVIGEMSRCLKVGGSIVIVSHLNAAAGDEGMEWVQDVVVEALMEFGGRWRIKCHISENDFDCGEESEISPGPAVYVITRLRGSGRFEQASEYKIPFDFVEH